MRERRKMLLVFLIGFLIATVGTAAATRQLTGRDIKNGTITAKDLSKSLRTQLKKAGRRGPQGPAGPPGKTGATGTVDTSSFYTKSQSDARFPRMEVTEKSAQYGISVPANAQSPYPALNCGDNALPGKGRFETIGFDSSYVDEAYGSHSYQVTVINPTGSTLYGSIKIALSCVGIDPSTAPVPALP
ncbi:MAG: hypothetical protein KDB62_05325 [Solirubrobacterales bacterium]|nr:hypothetical protein [Solirubrobacterales bacterium]